MNAWYEQFVKNSECWKYTSTTNSQLVCKQINVLAPGDNVGYSLDLKTG